MFGEIFDKIHARFEGHLDGDHGLDCSVVEAGLIDQLDLRVADIHRWCAARLWLQRARALLGRRMGSSPKL